MNTEHIRMFLAFAYSDEQLAALLAHTQTGKLSYHSCCCLIGIPTAPHPLRTIHQFENEGGREGGHDGKARQMLPFADKAESEFCELGMVGTAEQNDAKRRELLIPMIISEMERREKAREQSIAAETTQVG